MKRKKKEKKNFKNMSVSQKDIWLAVPACEVRLILL